MDSDAESKETLQPRLERYVIADDVLVEDVTDRLSILHVISETAPTLAAAKWIVTTRRFSQPGWDIWMDGAERENALSKLSGSFRFCDDNRAEFVRIHEGIPRWGRELTSEIIPVEANLEERCVDYEKGCYIGQEVISRMKMSGQRNKKLCGLISVDNRPLVAGMHLVEASQKDKNIGWITSALRDERRGREIALGFVKRGSNSAGKKLEALNQADRAGSGIAVEVVDLPFHP